MKFYKFFFIIIIFPVLASARPEFIDIGGAVYSRLKLSIENLTTENTNKINRISNQLEKNLLYSGFFDLTEAIDESDIRILISIKKKNLLQIAIFTQQGVELYSSNKKISEINKDDVISKLAEEITFKLTGEKGVKNTAIVFSEQKNYKSKDLVITDAHGRNHKTILHNSNYNMLPRWSPDGDAVIFTSTGDKGNSVNMISFKKSPCQIRTVANFTGLNTGGTWGIKKDEVIVTISKKGNPDIYRIRLPELNNSSCTKSGKVLERLTRRSSIDTVPSWSPDGKYLLFVSNRSGSIQIYQKDLETGDTFRMTFEGKYNTDPRWSRDSKKIAYASKVKGTFQIFTMNSYGEEIKQLTSGNESSEQPAWSPDGRQIVFTKTVKGVPKIFTMTADGLYQRRLTKSPPKVREGNPAWTGNYKWDLN